MRRGFFDLRVGMQIEVRRIAAPQARRHVGGQIEAIAHAPFAALRRAQMALPALAARQRRLDHDAVALGDLPSLGGCAADLFDPADRLVSRNDRHLAEAADLELAEILVVVGAAQAVGLDP
jgi:hypothetical protein